MRLCSIIALFLAGCVHLPDPQAMTPIIPALDDTQPVIQVQVSGHCLHPYVKDGETVTLQRDYTSVQVGMICSRTDIINGKRVHLIHMVIAGDPDNGFYTCAIRRNGPVLDVVDSRMTRDNYEGTLVH